MIKINVTWHNAGPHTIWGKLAAKLSREPTSEEAAAEVKRILRGENNRGDPSNPDPEARRLGNPCRRNHWPYRCCEDGMTEQNDSHAQDASARALCKCGHRREAHGAADRGCFMCGCGSFDWSPINGPAPSASLTPAASEGMDRVDYIYEVERLQHDIERLTETNSQLLAQVENAADIIDGLLAFDLGSAESAVTFLAERDGSHPLVSPDSEVSHDA